MSNYPPPPNSPQYPPQYSPQYAPQYPPPPPVGTMPPMPAPGPRKYSLFAAMAQTPFFNGEVYRDVARNWRGINFFYLFTLLFITWVVILVKLHIGVGAFARDEFPDAIKDFPPITITNGHVSSPVVQPFTMNLPKSDKPFVVLDTTGAIPSLDYTQATILITEQKAFARQGNGTEIREYDLSKIQSFYIDKSKLTAWMGTFSKWFAVGLLPIVMIGSLIYRLIEAMIYGAIGLGFSSAFGANLDFAATMRLGILAMTPVIILDTIFRVVGLSIPFWSFLCLGISILYIAISVKANKRIAVGM